MVYISRSHLYTPHITLTRRRRGCHRSVLLELEALRRDSRGRDNEDFDGIASVYVALACRDEALLYQLHGLGDRQRRLGVGSVLATNEFVEQRNDQLLAAALRCVLHALKATHGIVRKNGTLARRINARNDLRDQKVRLRRSDKKMVRRGEGAG